MSSNESDIEMQSALPKKALKKAPRSPTADILRKQEIKKISTKEMIHQALVDLKSRKGTSLYAIKKYIEEKYNVDVEKINYIIKKYLKTSVELGTIVQTKGVGASGSFKLAAGKDKLEKNKKKIEKKPEKPEKSKPKEKTKTVKKVETNEKKVAKKMPKKVEIAKSAKDNKKEKDATKKSNNKKEKVVKSKASKMAKGMQTPAKKRAAMMKRKSIGSIIKPPKMKPKAKA